MVTSKKKYIGQETFRILMAAKCEQPPVDPQKIAESLGLRVIFFAFPDKVDGVLRKEAKAIGINQSKHPNRQRFTIAHELGHYHLKHGVEGGGDELIDEGFDKPTDIEKEANIFAACLLMPEKWMKQRVAENGLDLKRLAKDFQVSEQALTVRLLDLRLI